MNGVYVGKNYAGLTEIFTMLEVPKEDWRTLYDIIGLIDKYRGKVINDKVKKK
jgi:hypothetical protein